MQAMSVHEREEEWVWSSTGAEWTALREQGKENMINDTDTIWITADNLCKKQTAGKKKKKKKDMLTNGTEVE